MFSLERANRDKPITWPTLIGLLLVPLLVVGGLLGATWGSTNRLNTVEAAVVNNDQMVEVNGQQMPMGRQLASAMVKHKDDNFKWVLADEKSAKSGLESGRYAAVVTIPKDFSAKVTSFSGTPSAATQATINIQTSQYTGVADTVIAQQIADAATDETNKMVTGGYLGQIYLGFNEQKKGMTTIADGAKQIATGQDALTDGLGQAQDGAVKLADGAQQYVDGVGQAATGSRALADGLGQLADGADKAATGGDQLADGADKLASGGGALADGANQLASGMDQLAAGGKPLKDGGAGLQAGVEKYTTGVGAYTGGVKQLNEGIQQMLGPVDAIDSSKIDATQLKQAATLVGQADQATKATIDGMVAFTAMPCQVPDGMTPEQETAYCQAWADAKEQLNQKGADGLTPVQRAQQVVNGQEYQDAVAGVQELLPRIPEIIDGAKAMKAGSQQLADSGDLLAAGGTELSSGVSQYTDGVGQYVDGVSAAAGGSRQLATGIGAYTDGASQLATGIKAFVAGIHQLAQGTQLSADGGAKLADGMDQLAVGGQMLPEGARGLSDGLGLSKDGSGQLAKGQHELADGVAKGAEAIPSYSDLDRLTLANVVTRPIDRGTAGDLLPASAATSLLMVLGLWLGALATYVVTQAVSATFLTSSKPTGKLLFKALAPGLAIVGVQAVALALIGQIVLDLSLGKTLGVLAFLLFGGAMFAVVNHALAAWLGGAGRLISLAMWAVAAAAGAVSAVPGLFGLVLPYLPLTPVLHGVRSIMTGGGGMVGAVGAVLFWLVLGLGASAMAVLKARQVTPETLMRTLQPRFA